MTGDDISAQQKQTTAATTTTVIDAQPAASPARLIQSTTRSCIEYRPLTAPIIVRQADDHHIVQLALRCATVMRSGKSSRAVGAASAAGQPLLCLSVSLPTIRCGPDVNGAPFD